MDISFHKETKNLDEVPKAIIACPQCEQKLRVPVFRDKQLVVRCPKCKNEISFDCKKYRIKKRITFFVTFGVFLFLLLIDIGVVVYLFSKINSVSTKLNTDYEIKIKEIQLDFSKEKKELQDKYLEEVRAINPVQLKIIADEYYSKIWEERLNYSSKYAITPREKAQLEMLSLSKDKTKSVEDIIRKIATTAAPKNSTINVYSLEHGYNLDIDFDMSELSAGEEGSRTKHHSIDSLKRDVVRLISKVTNDVYQFCQNLGLDSISIGCRHYVRQYDEYKSYRGEANTVLYKIRIDKEGMYELKNNPFLGIYSTTKYFKVEKDDFKNIEISISQEQ